MTLVDTTVWIDIFSGRNTAQVAMLESLIDKREDICLCGVIPWVLSGVLDQR
jgi:predicted nucleic acid-binding protein